MDAVWGLLTVVGVLVVGALIGWASWKHWMEPRLDAREGR